MNNLPWSAILAVILAAVLSIWLGWLFGRRGKTNAPLGLPEGSVRGMIALAIVAAVLVMPAFGVDVPDFLKAAFGLVVGLYFGSRNAALESRATVARDSNPATPPPPKDAALESRATEGFIRLRVLLLLCAICGLGVAICLTMTGCSTIMPPVIGAAQKANDKLAERYGMTDQLSAARIELAKSEAAKAGMIILPETTVAFPEKFFEVSTGREITGGVQKRQIYEVREDLAPPTAPLAPTAPATQPSSPPVAAPPAGATSLPPTTQPPPPANLPTPDAESIGTSGGDSEEVRMPNAERRIEEARNYRVAAKVDAATGALASLVEKATLEAEVTVQGASGFMDAGGAVKCYGKIVAISNAPPLDLAPLHFENYPGSISNGILLITSRPGSDIAFDGRALISNGACKATLLPTAGSSAAAFFQRLEISGSAIFTGASVVTNMEPVRPAPGSGAGGPDSTSADAIDVAKIQQRGPNGRPPFNTLPITRKLTSASIGGGKVSWKGEGWTGSSGMGGRCLIFWQQGDHYVGGHFDWMKNGQHLKGLENVEGGYIDGQIPPRGATIYFAIANHGDLGSQPTERSNVIQCEGTW